MPYYVVTYDLKNKTADDYKRIDDELDKLNSAKYQESAYFVDDSRSANQLLNHLKYYVNNDDKLMVIKFRHKPRYNKALSGTNKWIEDRSFTTD